MRDCGPTICEPKLPTRRLALGSFRPSRFGWLAGRCSPMHGRLMIDFSCVHDEAGRGRGPRYFSLYSDALNCESHAGHGLVWSWPEITRRYPEINHEPPTTFADARRLYDQFHQFLRLDQILVNIRHRFAP